MMAKLLIEGKEFDIEILNPEMQNLLTSYVKKTGYERVPRDEVYYCETDSGEAFEDDECCCEGDDEAYDGANYYSAKSVADNNARADKLMRQLRRFAVEHRDKCVNWHICADKFVICYDYESNQLFYEPDVYSRVFGAIYFTTEEAADDAIETFHDELMWYFTEYKDSL